MDAPYSVYSFPFSPHSDAGDIRRFWARLPGAVSLSSQDEHAAFSSLLSGSARNSARTFKNAYPRWRVTLDGWQFLA
jgi:hypothetical protein